jgi:hypothetical protein
MQILNQQGVAEVAVESILESYQSLPDEFKGEVSSVMRSLVTHRLHEITPELLSKIIGHELWSTTRCMECGSLVYEAVMFNRESVLCFECVRKAGELVDRMG